MKHLALILSLVIACSSLGCKEETKSEIKVISTQEMQTLLKMDQVQLVDVRTTSENTVSHLKNAQNICVTNDDFKEKVETLDKNEPVYVYCKKGGRSAKAAKILTDMGFTKVYDLQGGITNWEEKGLDTEM